MKVARTPFARSFLACPSPAARWSPIGALIPATPRPYRPETCRSTGYRRSAATSTPYPEPQSSPLVLPAGETLLPIVPGQVLCNELATQDAFLRCCCEVCRCFTAKTYSGIGKEGQRDRGSLIGSGMLKTESRGNSNDSTACPWQEGRQAEKRAWSPIVDREEVPRDRKPPTPQPAVAALAKSGTLGDHCTPADFVQ